MDFRLDLDAVAAALDAVERRCWLFENMPLDPLHRDWLRERAWVRTVHGTTRIEGNTLNALEVEQLLEGSVGRGLPRKDALEVLGTRTALEFADGLASVADVPIDEALIREAHRRILAGQSELLTPGEYRRGENRVGGPAGEILFTTPPSGDVPELMRAFAAWLRDDHGLPVPVRAALAHLEFVAIHPFNDGNGRTARLIARILLMRGGYGLDGLVSLDAHLDLHRSDYFASIRASIGRTYVPGFDATPFVAFFLEAFSDAADHVLSRIRGLGDVQIRVRRDVVEGELVPPMLDALVYAWINRSLRPADYQRITRRPPSTTTRDLGQAVTLRYLEPVGERRSRWYRLGERLRETPAIDEPADPRQLVPRA